MATHRLLDLKMLMHLLLANPYYGMEPQKSLEEDVHKLLETLLDMDTVKVIGGC